MTYADPRKCVTSQRTRTNTYFILKNSVKAVFDIIMTLTPDIPRWGHQEAATSPFFHNRSFEPVVRKVRVV